MAESVQNSIIESCGGGSSPLSSHSRISFPLLRWSWVSGSVAVLLLAAAVLKISGLAIAPAGSVRDHFVGLEILVGLELLLAAWLWSGMYLFACWLTTCITFAGFAAASFYLGWIGQASCGCLGAMVTINPWHTFAFDVLILGCLLSSRPIPQPALPNPHGSNGGVAAQLAAGAAAVAVLWAVLAGLAYVLYGSPEAALAAMRGEGLSIRPSVVDVGTGAPGQLLSATVELVNRTDHAIRVYGGTSDCSCIATDDLPLTIPPGQAHSIGVKIKLPAAAGFSRGRPCCSPTTTRAGP